MDTSDAPGNFDAFLLVSFGGPESPADVGPFLENVTRGRGVPPERLIEVAEHYQQFGGVSPLNGQCRALLAALEKEFAVHGIGLPIHWGNRNWHPFLAAALEELAASGARRVLAFVTSAFSSYSGCRQYREDLAAAQAMLGPSAPMVEKIRQFFNHPGFISPQIDAVLEALASLPAELRAEAVVTFTTHSIPTSMARRSGPAGGAYLAQHLEVARLVAEGVAQASGFRHPWRLVFQSRSGPPALPWLEPDVRDHLAELADAGVRAVVVSPIGFLSDHLEVCYDLDVEARAVAAELGLAFARAATVDTAPAFVSAIRELVVERLDPAAPRRALGGLGTGWDTCAAVCCPNPRAALPVVAGRS